MANELTVTCSMNFAKGVLSNAFAVSALHVGVSDADYMRATFTAPTTAAALPLGAVATPGFILIQNHDTTNYVDIAASVADIANPLVRLLPGEVALFRLAATAPAVKANTAPVQVEYLLIPN